MLQRSVRAVGFVEPCLPSPAKAAPTGPDWLHEIKHDRFRIEARRDAKGVRLITRNSHDFSGRFAQIVAVAVAVLPVRSCLIDGEAIVSDEAGLAVLKLIRSWRHDHAVVFCAFDLLELDGEDLLRRSRCAKPGLPSCCCASRRKALPSTSITSARRHRLSASLQTRLRGYRVEATRLDVPLRPLEAMGQGQEPGGAGSVARGRGRVAQIVEQPTR